MSTKTGLGALALVAAATIAGAGWALQTPAVDVLIPSGLATVHASPPEQTPQPSLSLLNWPGPLQESDDPAADTGADKAQNIDGLEAMSATGAAAPQY